MPNYDYRCLSCGHEYELFQSISEKPAAKCPECGKKVQRLFGGGAGVSFKGTGFYVTDYKKPSASQGSCASGGPKPAGGCGKPACN
jgi:putative FmdB family regulatory protein